MPVLNSEIASAFDELGDLLEIQGANPFRVRAYRNAARVIASWPRSLSEVLKAQGEIPKLPGIGTDLAGKIEEMIRLGPGKAPKFIQQERKKVPEGVRALLRIPGLGPKRVRILQLKLKIRSLKDLEGAVKRGKLSELSGFGPKTEQRILEELARMGTPRAASNRMSLSVAEEAARPLLEYVRNLPGVRNAIVAGSFRRKKETVGDLDVLVAANDHQEEIRQGFVSYEDRIRILANGPTRSAILLRTGLQVDLRIVPPESYGAALHYFTGSKAHNIAIRALGVKRKLKINEYGVFRGMRRIGGKTEEEVFAAVGLPYIQPELRENTGEIDAAREGKLPKLIELKDIRGDLHAHTKATDGRQNVAEMAEAARAKGYEYLAITDHSKHLSVATGLDAKRLRKQIEEIDRLNERFKGFRILKASEVDILEDGSLDLPDEILRELDLTVCSIHFKFNLSKTKQTERVIRAMDNPCFKILGHPVGRLIGQREPMDLDLEKIMVAAKDRGCFLEINSQPDRLDLMDTYCRLATQTGVRLAISTDAHSTGDLGFMHLGVAQARRGWVETKDVLNTLPWKKLQAVLKRS